jgi:hypothetical protein
MVMLKKPINRNEHIRDLPDTLELQKIQKGNN